MNGKTYTGIYINSKPSLFLQFKHQILYNTARVSQGSIWRLELRIERENWYFITALPEHHKSWLKNYNILFIKIKCKDISLKPENKSSTTDSSSQIIFLSLK